MQFIPTTIPDVIVIEPQVFGDERGFFLETFQQREFADAGITPEFVQDNWSHSQQGILRGLHYQIQQPQGKLTQVQVGEVYDVAVDLRRSSPTFGKWVSVTLSGENKHLLWVPPGFAHGFYVTKGPVDFLYKCTDFYAPDHERSLLWNDQELAIPWPIPADESPTLSAKDAAGTPFRDCETYG